VVPAPPSGKKLTEAGIVIDRLQNGKVVEHWVVHDDLSLLQ
jgi:predicted ester cyclase